jgi:hypothetical protein
MIDFSILAGRGEEAVDNYLVSTGEMNIRNHINTINEQIASGGRGALYRPGQKSMYAAERTRAPSTQMSYLAELGEVVEKQGSEAGLAFAKENFTAEHLGQDVSMLPKEIGSRIRGSISSGASDKAAQALKAVNAMNTAGARTGVMSKKTLINVLKAGQAALKVVGKKENIILDFM